MHSRHASEAEKQVQKLQGQRGRFWKLLEGTEGGGLAAEAPVATARAALPTPAKLAPA